MDNLSLTKKRLTVIFTVIIFVIVLFLGLLFFSAKYLNALRLEKTVFIQQTNLIQNKFKSLEGFIFASSLRKNVLENRNIEILTSNEIILNYLVINKDQGIIISSNIDFSISKLRSIILDNKEYVLVQKHGFLVKKYRVMQDGITHDVIFLQKISYTFEDFLHDIINYLIVIVAFSILFYYTGYRYVNQALKPVEENIDDMKHFIQNAGHELKTPISVIDSNTQLIDEMKSYDEGLTREIREETGRMCHLLSGLLELTNINRNKALEDLNLKNEIDGIIAGFKTKIHKKHIKVKVIIPKDITIKSNKDYISIFLSNLIGNAIKYNKKGGRIDIIYNSKTLVIKDSGIGIHIDKIEKIFDRFYKADESRNTEGIGIGLSLVKKIADIYKRRIKVESDEGKGTTFKVKFK